MAKYLFLAMADCSDPSREDEFNKWYDGFHIPDVLSAPGVTQATRYINIDPEGNKRPKYLIAYEIETANIDNFDKDLTEVIMKSKAAGRGTDCVVPDRNFPLKRPYFKQMAPAKKAPKSKG